MDSINIHGMLNINDYSMQEPKQSPGVQPKRPTDDVPFNVLLLKMAIEIVDLPIKMVVFRSYVNVNQRVTTIGHNAWSVTIAGYNWK